MRLANRNFLLVLRLLALYQVCMIVSDTLKSILSTSFLHITVLHRVCQDFHGDRVIGYRDLSNYRNRFDSYRFLSSLGI
ncbi:MAG: hypothetical protein JRJ87_02105 [Deltaproteobacteria bacterium]|nr:hypothetical protein [Deltaproteobacteria bacterium]